VRLIQATVPRGATDDVKRVLERRDVDYFATHETGTDEYEEVLYLSISEEMVEGVLKNLYDTGLDSNDHAVIIDTEVDIFGRTDGKESSLDGYARIASAELEGKTEDLIPDFRTFVTMMILSTIVATTGVLLDSSAVVVGSMVLAPLFGPAVSASVGTVIDETDLFWNGVKYQVVGVAIAVVAASVSAWAMKTAYLLPSGFALSAAPQIVERLSPDLLSLVVAFVAGVAGVISIATASGRALVGVMMAAALLPPAAVVGIGVAWTSPGIAIHSGILLLVNLLAINFAGLVTLWYLGYRPQSWIKVPQTRRALLKRGGVLLVAILVTSAFLWNVTYANAQRSQLNDALEQDIRVMLDDEGYEEVALVDVRVIQDEATFTHDPDRVVVTIGRPPGETDPQLHRDIQQTVRAQVGWDIPVDIQVSLRVRSDPAADPATHELPASAGDGRSA